MLSAHYEFFDGFSFIFLCFECFIVFSLRCLTDDAGNFMIALVKDRIWSLLQIGRRLEQLMRRQSGKSLELKSFHIKERFFISMNSRYGCLDAVAVLMLCLSWCCGCLDGIECLPFYFILWPLGNWVLQMLNTCLGLLFGLANAFNWFWWPLFWNWLLLKA